MPDARDGSLERGRGKGMGFSGVEEGDSKDDESQVKEEGLKNGEAEE